MTDAALTARYAAAESHGRASGKIMHAISSCIATIQGLPTFKSNDDLQQLHSVLQEAMHNPQQLDKLIKQSRDQAKQPLPRVEQPEQRLPRVEPFLTRPSASLVLPPQLLPQRRFQSNCIPRYLSQPARRNADSHLTFRLAHLPQHRP